MAAGDGLVTMTPTSIVVAGAGSSASINADGGVDFTAVTSLSLNGVFTSSFDNYLIVFAGLRVASGAEWLKARLRVSGTDASTAANYTYQFLNANGTTYDGGRGNEERVHWITSGLMGGGFTMAVYGPALAQPTAWRTVTVNSSNDARIIDYAVTHSLSTSYDGLTFLIADAGGMTGNIAVFGYEE